MDMVEEHVVKNTVWYSKWTHAGSDCVIIYGLFVHPKMRGCGIASRLINIAIDEIKKAYPGLSIVAQIKPFDNGLNYDQLRVFYLKHGIKIIE